MPDLDLIKQAEQGYAMGQVTGISRLKQNLPSPEKTQDGWTGKEKIEVPRRWEPVIAGLH